jgi:hypothetical protein
MYRLSQIRGATLLAETFIRQGKIEDVDTELRAIEREIRAIRKDQKPPPVTVRVATVNGVRRDDVPS